MQGPIYVTVRCSDLSQTIENDPHVEYKEGFKEAQDSRPHNEFVVDSGSSGPNRP